MAPQTEERSFLKKIVFGLLIIGMLPGLAWAADVRPLKKPTIPTNAPTIKQGIELQRAAKIKTIGFRTEPNGKWSYIYEVQNTGPATLDLRQARFNAIQILANGSQVPVHTVHYGTELNPGQTATGCEPLNRSGMATRLKLEIYYGSVMLDATTVDIPPLSVKITSAVFDQDKRKWGVNVKNNSGYALNVSMRPIAADGRAGAEVAKLVPAGGITQCSGLSNFDAPTGLQAIFRDEKPGQQPGYAVLDTYSLSSRPSFGNLTQPADKSRIKAFVESITWTRATKQWVATVKNNTALPLSVGIAGFPLENGQQGMTIWSNETIPAEGSTRLEGDYRDFPVPPGTRLKVHVLLKPSNEKVHEKIITLD